MEEQTQLKFFQARLVAMNTRGGSFTLLEVTCPRKDCNSEGQPFYMPLSWRRSERVVSGRGDEPDTVIKTAACPWCFRPSRKPKIKRRTR